MSGSGSWLTWHRRAGVLERLSPLLG